MKLWAPQSERVLRQCWGKEAFDRMGQAQRAAARMNRGPNRKRPVQAFRCPFCAKHHVGGARKPKLKEVR